MWGNEKKLIEIIETETRIIEKLLGKFHPHPVRMVHTTTFNNTKIQIMAFDPLPANQKAPIQIALQDVVTGQMVTATSSNVSNVSDNPAAATVDADNKLVGVAAGVGNLTTGATWAYTDSTGAPQTTTLVVQTPFTITAVVTADQVQMVVTLSTPVAQ